MRRALAEYFFSRSAHPGYLCFVCAHMIILMRVVSKNEEDIFYISAKFFRLAQTGLAAAHLFMCVRMNKIPNIHRIVLLVA